MVHDQRFDVYPLFLNVARDDAGNARVEFDLELFAPSGESRFREEDVQALDGASGIRSAVHLSREIRTLGLGPSSELGTYRVVVTARDIIGESTATSEATIRLSEYVAGKGFSDAAAAADWMHDFAEASSSRRAVAAFVTFAQSIDNGEPEFREESDLVRGFFLELFEFNHWLIPHLMDGFAERTESVRREILRQLSRSSIETAPFVARLSPDDRALWKKLLSDKRDPIDEPITGLRDLQVLWGRYLTYRRFDPVMRLAETLDAESPGVVLEGTIHDFESGQDVSLARYVQLDSREAFEEIVAFDPIVAAYCAFMLENLDISPALVVELEDLLE